MRFQHEQDSRHMGKTLHTNKFFTSTLYGPILSLIGFPRVRGFLSKDKVLEEFFLGSQSIIPYAVIILNVVLSYLYAYKLLILTFKENISHSFVGIIRYSPRFQLIISILGALGTRFGYIFCEFLSGVSRVFPIPMEIKVVYLSLNTLGLSCLIRYSNLGTIYGTNFLYRMGYISVRNNFMASIINSRIFSWYTGVKVNINHATMRGSPIGRYISTGMSPLLSALGASACLGVLLVRL